MTFPWSSVWYASRWKSATRPGTSYASGCATMLYVSDAGEIYSNMVLEDIDGKTTRFRWFAERDMMPDPVQHENMRDYVEAMYNRCADSIEMKLTARA